MAEGGREIPYVPDIDYDNGEDNTDEIPPSSPLMKELLNDSLEYRRNNIPENIYGDKWVLAKLQKDVIRILIYYPMFVRINHVQTMILNEFRMKYGNSDYNKLGINENDEITIPLIRTLDWK